MMEFQASDHDMLPRRGFLALGGRLAAAGVASSLLPVPLWARAADKYPTIRAQFTAYVAAKKLAGMAAAIGHGTAAPDLVAVGHIAQGNKTPVDLDSLWRIYSMTKPVTGMAAMILIGEGRMKLDQPIADFLPEFANMTVLTDPANSLKAVPAKNQITVRHLLTHTAGLGYAITTRGPLLQAYLDNGLNPVVVSRFPIPGLPKSAPTPDFKIFSQRLATLPLIAEPGTKWSYSVSLDLLGRVIEAASGMDFEAFLTRRIFEPLKMTNSYFQVPAAETKRLVTNYAPINGVLFPLDPAASSIYLDKPAFAFGGSGMVCSARDYDRFLAMLLNGGTLDGVRVMSAKMAALGMSNLLPDGIDLKGSFVEGAGFGAGGRVGIGAEAGSFGWGGAAGTVAFLDRKRNIRATGMAQYMPSETYPIHREFSQWVLADIDKKGA
jgi:CubicO group peptidase (beta-lactamase class C family)